MRNSILSKAVPAWEFCSFCDSQKCVPLVRQFLEGDSDPYPAAFRLINQYSPPF
jgi:hypothetical protein